MSKKTAQPTFEKALMRLEAIVDAVENGDTTLDEAVALYREGIGLSKTCGEILNRYETEITQLQREADGVFALKPFNAETAREETEI